MASQFDADAPMLQHTRDDRDRQHVRSQHTIRYERTRFDRAHAEIHSPRREIRLHMHNYIETRMLSVTQERLQQKEKTKETYHEEDEQLVVADALEQQWRARQHADIHRYIRCDL
ncbi:hypothetical protein FI667_g188, partial [Globisporangium splendens]